jgi:GTP cyclohydrolase III
MNNTKSAYIAIDGDDVGNKLEFFILMNQLGQLKSFSESFAESFCWLEDRLIENLNANLIFSGGDNLLADVEDNNELVNKLDLFKSDFLRQSGCSLSIGLGASAREAYMALKLAKVSGKNRVCRLPLE